MIIEEIGCDQEGELILGCREVNADILNLLLILDMKTVSDLNVRIQERRRKK